MTIIYHIYQEGQWIQYFSCRKFFITSDAICQLSLWTVFLCSIFSLSKSLLTDGGYSVFLNLLLQKVGERCFPVIAIVPFPPVILSHFCFRLYTHRDFSAESCWAWRKSVVVLSADDGSGLPPGILVHAASSCWCSWVDWFLRLGEWQAKLLVTVDLFSVYFCGFSQ